MTTQTNPTGDAILVFAGLLTLDVAQRAESLPDLGGKGTADAAYMDVGGPAANAAVTAALLGASARLHTVVGHGRPADFIRDALDNYGVAVSDHAPDAAVPLASVWVLAGTGERTILATNNTHLTIDPEGPLLPQDTAAVLLDGHYPDIARAAAAEAASAGIPVVLDCGRWRPIFSELLPLATDVIMCESFRPPGRVAATGEELLHDAAAEWPAEVWAMSRGAQDLLVLHDGTRYSVPVPQVDVVDTTGAGDVLHGAYLYFRYVAHLDPLDALERSVEMASTSCTHLAVRPGVADAN